MRPLPTVAAIISAHVIISWAMTSSSQDECSCGHRIEPDQERAKYEPLQDRRRRGYANHVANEIVKGALLG